MFIISQDGDHAFKADIIDHIVAAYPREDDNNKMPIVVAVIGNHEEELGRYNSIADCKTAISYIAGLVNSHAKSIEMPSLAEMRFINEVNERNGAAKEQRMKAVLAAYGANPTVLTKSFKVDFNPLEGGKPK